MKIILKEKVENLGVLGDVVNVRSGYARNFLVPFGKAVQATPANIANFELQKAELEKAEAQRFAEAQARAAQIENKTFTIIAQAGEGGKLFGSVGTKEVADAIQAETNIPVEKRHVRMPEGVIRSIGEVELTVHLYTGIDATIKVVVVAE